MIQVDYIYLHPNDNNTDSKKNQKRIPILLYNAIHHWIYVL